MRGEKITQDAAPTPHPARVAVIIVNYRTPDLTLRCLASLSHERESVASLEVMVVDGGSADGSAERLGAAIQQDYRDWVTFLPLSINGGFGWANNQAILTLSRSSRAPDLIHLLNPDTEVKPGAVAALAGELLAHPRCGAAGSQLLNPEGEPAASAFRFPSIGREFITAARSEKLGRALGIAPTVVTAADSVEVDWVTGASLMFKAEALRDCGLFDDGFFLYFEEVELLQRLRRHGWTVRHVPASRVVHTQGAATGVDGRAERPLPPYWYVSRRRYFSLTAGRLGALTANLARLAGSFLGRLKGPAEGVGSAHMANGSLLKWGFYPRQEDCRPASPHWGDTPGAPPAWLQDRQAG